MLVKVKYCAQAFHIANRQIMQLSDSLGNRIAVHQRDVLVLLGRRHMACSTPTFTTVPLSICRGSSH